MADHYQTLGVTKTATAEEIRAAYLRIAFTEHPDKKPGDKAASARFNEATAAYKILFDPGKRASYDATTGIRLGGLSHFPWGGHDDFIKSIFKNAYHAAPPKPKSKEYRLGVELTVDEVLLGCTKPVSVPEVQLNVMMQFQPGYVDGTQVRMVAKDSTWVVFVEISVKSDPRYTIKEHYLEVVESVIYPTLVLGGTIPVQTPRGIKNVTIPALSQPGRKFDYPEEGVPWLNGKRPGKMSIVLALKMAPHSEEQLKQLNEYAKSLGMLPRKKSIWRR